jgi:hypothetical protein
MVQAELERRVAQLRGSEPWTEQDARLVLDALAGSGETVAGFAQRMKLVPQRLFWWRKRLRSGTRGRSESALAKFVPMVVRPEAPGQGQPGNGVAISLGAVRVDVRELSAATAAWVATVVRALSEPTS